MTLTTTNTEQLAPGTGLRVKIPAGIVDVELGYHDVAAGTFVVRIVGLPGYHAVARTQLVELLSVDECERLNIDSTLRSGFACGEWEPEPQAGAEAVYVDAVVGIYQNVYGRRRPGQIWAAPSDLARELDAQFPDAGIDLDKFADYSYALDELGLFPREMAERLVTTMLAGDIDTELAEF